MPRLGTRIPNATMISYLLGGIWGGRERGRKGDRSSVATHSSKDLSISPRPPPPTPMQWREKGLPTNSVTQSSSQSPTGGREGERERRSGLAAAVAHLGVNRSSEKAELRKQFRMLRTEEPKSSVRHIVIFSKHIILYCM